MFGQEANNQCVKNAEGSFSFDMSPMAYQPYNHTPEPILTHIWKWK